MQRGFSNIADISAKLFRFWGGATSSVADSLQSAGEGKPPLFSPGGPSGAGKIVQSLAVNSSVVNETAVNIPLDDTIPQAAEGGFVLTAPDLVSADTPGANTIVVIGVAVVAGDTAGAIITGFLTELVNGSDAFAICGMGAVHAANAFVTMPIYGEIVTAAPFRRITFRAGANVGMVSSGGTPVGAGGTRVYGTTPKVWMRLLEIAP